MRCRWVPSTLSIAAVAAAATQARADCFDEAGRAHSVSPQLLRAVARAESGLRPNALHRNADGSRDIGLMQVNSRWLPKLARYGIGERELRDPCTNVRVGAWLLADVLARHGNTWDAVGANNAACTQLKGEACRRARQRYAWSVFRQWPHTAPAGPAAPRAGLVSLAQMPQAPGTP